MLFRSEKFFEYALMIADKRKAYDEELKDPLNQFQTTPATDGAMQPWLDSFCKPAYVGDIMNQEMFPYDQLNMVPIGFRVPLPTKEIADAWNK